MDTEPPASLFHLDIFLAIAFDWTILVWFLILIVLLICSALVSGSEVAFFSLSPNDLHDIHQEKDPTADKLIELKEKPRKLLATILISNNFINIAIVIISDFLLKKILPKESLQPMAEWFGNYIPAEVATITNAISFIITIVGVTFLLVLFGEVAPKIYASINNRKFALMMTGPMSIMSSVYAPISNLMVFWTGKLEKRFQSRSSGTSREEIDKAIDLTVNQEQNAEEEADILKGIIKFGDLLVKQIMRSRTDVVAINIESGFDELLSEIRESRYSRIPVFKDDFDNVVGILYVKDLINNISEGKDYEWQGNIRTNVLYVPESKKIDELLREFQQKHLHMAIVVDEFGGSSGIVTLEDIMEQVIGEIKDESDEESEIDYVKIDDSNFVFDGKTLLNDVCRITGEDVDVFDTARGESDSLAGLVLENLGHIPKRNKEFILDKYKLKVISVSKKRIEKIKFTILET